MRLPTYQMLSREQDRILNIPTNESCIVTGPPGTGKTVVALYRANILKNKKEPVKIIMYGRLLSRYTESATGALDIESSVSTYHSWFTSTYRSLYRKRIVPQLSNFVYDWDEILKTVNENPQKKINDHVIIDEGQDLPNEFYIFVKSIAPRYSIFADENQQITDTNSTLDEIRIYSGLDGNREYRLEKNYRNTREIAEVAEHFYAGLETGCPELPDRRGAKPVMKQTRNFRESVDFIARFARTNKDIEIGVFTYKLKTQERILNALKNELKGYNIIKYSYNTPSDELSKIDFDRPGILVINHPSSKGLEFDVVFIPELQEMAYEDDINKIKMRLYVMSARARDQLFFMYSGDGDPLILGIFPRERLDWR